MNRIGWMVAATLLVAAPLAAQEAKPTAKVEQQQSIEQQVRALLGGVENVPTDAQWAAVGPGAVPVLVRVMTDAKETAVTRGRAAIALGNFPTPESVAALRGVVVDAGSSRHLLRKAVVALARAEGASALDVLSPLLSHESKTVREDAIRAVGGFATHEAQALLRARHTLETSKYLRQVLTAELAKPIVQVPAAATPSTDGVAP